MVASNKAVAFILRAHSQTLWKGRKNITPLLDRYLYRVRSKPHVEQHESALLEVSSFIISANEAAARASGRYNVAKSSYPNNIVAKVIESFITLGHTSELKRAVACADGKLPVSAIGIMGVLLHTRQFVLLQPA